MSLAQIHKNDFGNIKNIGYIISVGHEKQVILGVGWNRTLSAVSKQYIFVLSLKMFDMLMFCWPRLKPTEKNQNRSPDKVWLSPLNDVIQRGGGVGGTPVQCRLLREQH